QKNCPSKFKPSSPCAQWSLGDPGCALTCSSQDDLFFYSRDVNAVPHIEKHIMSFKPVSAMSLIKNEKCTTLCNEDTNLSTEAEAHTEYGTEHFVLPKGPNTCSPQLLGAEG
ncbi:hypothetical protein HGM15179_016568, partial [Zosterops borbonicus]